PLRFSNAGQFGALLTRGSPQARHPPHSCGRDRSAQLRHAGEADWPHRRGALQVRSLTVPADPTTPQPLAAPGAPLTLAMPEPVVAVKEPDAALAMVALKEETRTAALTQADKFIADLMQMDVTSGEFRARVDSAFRLGRKEIGDSALLTGKFLDKNFVSDA